MLKMREVSMPEESMRAENRATTGTEAEPNQEVDTSTVQDLKRRQKLGRTSGPTAANRSAKAHTMLPSDEGTTETYILNYPAWHKPYGEALLQTDPEILVKLLATAEIAVFGRLLELATDERASYERQDIGRAIDVILTLKAGQTRAGASRLRHILKTVSPARQAKLVLRHNGKIEYCRSDIRM